MLFDVAFDIVFSCLYAYVLICLMTSKDRYFKRPFYTFFITTGVYSIVSVLSFIILSKFTYSKQDWTLYAYKPVYALNMVGACGATFGNALIAVHRYFVLRKRDFTEKNWSRNLIVFVLCLQFTYGLARTISVWIGSFASRADDKVSFDAFYTVILKMTSFTSYVIFIIGNAIFLFLILREHWQLRSSITGLSNSLLSNYKNLIIVVSVSSLSYLIKAFHQVGQAAATFFDEPAVFDVLFATYPVVNGISTFAPPICLVVFSSKVRARLLFKITISPMGSSAGVAPHVPVPGNK